MPPAEKPTKAVTAPFAGTGWAALTGESDGASLGVAPAPNTTHNTRPGALLSAAARWGFKGWGVSDLIENLSFWGSRRPRAAQKPFKKVGGFGPYVF